MWLARTLTIMDNNWDKILNEATTMHGHGSLVYLIIYFLAQPGRCLAQQH